MTQATADWENYWQGRRDENSGALTGVEHDAELQNFWRTQLASLSRHAVFADLACGAGTVLQTASQLGFNDLTGIDVSQSALATLSKTLDTVKTCHSSVARTPFADQHFDILTSQFGLEYAGAVEACQEVGRLLAPKGTFIAVMHKTDGGIYREVAGHARHAQQIKTVQFIPLSIALFQAVYAGDDARMAEVVTQLGPARASVAGLMTPGTQTFASHLLAGAGQLWERRAHYQLADIVNWFSGMANELEAFEGRMTSMLDASQSEAEMTALVDLFRRQNLTCERPSALQLGDQDAAWVLRVTNS